jgi:hypothetical protein
MDAKTWKITKEWIADLAELSASDRDAYLTEHCPDPALRHEVLALLAEPAGLSAILMNVALQRGARIGPYEIVERIGAGGMGEVYRASDLTLGRDVAIKVLPPAFAADPERLARLKREARLLAALNHPHIAHIYGLEESRGTRALVLELVGGETLADGIARGPIPLKEALPIARQVCQALAFAHDQGIIHRDLKPANIKLRPDGTVKVLDFGLAKMVTVDPAAGTGIQTLSAQATQDGVILGTAAYMSPEQASGKLVDRRTDLWAFGVVLFEMLAGRRAFGGASVVDTLSRVLRDDPDWRLLPSHTPPSIRRLLRRCFAKEPERRLSSAADAGLDIEDALNGCHQELADSGHAIRRRTILWVAVSLALVAVAAIWALAARDRHPHDDLPIRRFALTFPAGQEFMGSISVTPDGQAVVYGGPKGLIYRPLNKLVGTPIEGTNGAGGGTLSPSGQWVAFYGSDSSGEHLRKVRLNGGPVTTIAHQVHYSCGWTWMSDDVILSAEQPFGLFTVPVNAGSERNIAKPDPSRGEIGPCFPKALSDGRHAVVWKTGVQRLAIVDIATGRTTDLDGLATNPVDLAAGFLAFGRPDETLGAAPFDFNRTRSIEPAIAVDDQPRATNGGVSATLSNSGDLYYVKATNRTRVLLLDSRGQVVSRTQEEGNFFMPRVSPDGRRLVVARRTDSTPANWDLWLFGIASGVGQPVTNDGRSISPEWTSDGRIIYSRMNEGERGGSEVWVLDPDHRTKATKLISPTLPSGVVIHRTVLSPDSRYAIVTAVISEPSFRFCLYVADLRGDRQLRPLEPAMSSTFGAAFSADGHRLAYVSPETGRDEIYVRPFPQDGPSTRITMNGGKEPRWDSDSVGIMYRDSDDRFVRARLTTAPTLSVERLEELFSFHTAVPPISTRESDPTYDLAATNRFAVVERADLQQIIVVQGWVNELKARIGR